MLRPIFFLSGLTRLKMTQFSLGVVLILALLSSVCCTQYSKHLTVSEFGTNNASCLTGVVDCNTLWYALQGLENSTLISVTYSHVFIQTPSMYVNGLDNIAITGEESTIMCEDGAGISFVSSTNIVIDGISWIGCSVWHPTAGYYPQLNISFPNATSALFFHLCLNVTISNCTFQSQRGSGVSLYDTGGKVLIVHSDFTNHSNNCSSLTTNECSQISKGLSIEFTCCSQFETCQDPSEPSSHNSGAMYSILWCNFSSNVNSYDGRNPGVIEHQNSSWPFGKGGGLSLVIRGTARNNTFEIYSPDFVDNQAEFGGSVYVEIVDQASENNITFHSAAGTYSRFTGGQSQMGGAMHLAMFFSGGGNLDMGANAISVSDFIFDNNKADIWGGAVAFFSNGQHNIVHSWPVLFVNCHWINNNASSGGAVGISVEYTKVLHVLHPIIFVSNTWSDNGYLCTIATVENPLLFNGTTIVENSTSSGLCIESAEVYMQGEVTFRGNQGKYGGAISLSGSSWLTVGQGLHLIFENNIVTHAGGAIYFNNDVKGNVLLKYGVVHSCLFQYEDQTILIQDWDATIVFRNNQLIDNGDGPGTGSSIYMINTYGCNTSNDNILLFTENVFSYYPNQTGQLATPAIEFIPHRPIYLNNNVYTMDLMLGQYILFNITARDAFNSTVKTTTNVYLQCNTTNAGAYDGYHLNGARAVVIENYPFIADLQVSGPEVQPEGVSCYLVLDVAGPSDLKLYIKLNFPHPRLGFTYDPSLEIYTCFNSSYIHCNTTTLRVCLLYGYWYGKIEDNDTSVFTIAQCPSEMCKYFNWSCPTVPCDELQTYCEMQQIQDDQCSMNRGGPLCTECKANYSFTFDALECVDTNTCSAGNFILNLFINIVFLVVIIVGLLLILRLNLRVGSGYMYSFLYYFSVVEFLLPGTISSSFLNVLVINIASFTQLNPRFLGLISLCDFQQFNRLAHTALNYIQPIFISLAIALMSCLARCFPRFLRLAQISPIHAICLLILLSFTSITQTSFSLLGPINLQNISSIRVRLQPSITYFDPPNHLPYALLALLVEIVVVFPFTLLLLTAPLLTRFVNLTKIKPILDEYQACYRDRYRWMAGFYFLARQAVFLVSNIHIGNFVNPYFLLILSVVITVFHTALQPYTSWWLNVVDTVLLLDLTFISILYDRGTSNVVFQYSEEVRTVFLYILILIPCFYFIALCIALVVMRVKNRCRGYHKKFCSYVSRTARLSESINEPEEDSEEGVPPPPPTISYLPNVDESLLALLEYEEDNPPKQYNTFRQAKHD